MLICREMWKSSRGKLPDVISPERHGPFPPRRCCSAELDMVVAPPGSDTAEFVIGALFVARGVSTHDILYGLLLGNLMAVLTWGLVTAPIATDTRLTLYAYLEKIAGPGTIKLYSGINGILFAVLAGAMITVSASAVRILFGISPQVNWYPTDIGFVLIAVAVGVVVAIVAAKGFKKVAHFAEVCAPWMILMFVAGALAMLPVLINAAANISSISSFEDFVAVGDAYIWVDTGSDIGFWHVAAFAWICNLAMHGSMGDMPLVMLLIGAVVALDAQVCICIRN